ncbi:MAG: hypothetical protein Q9195_000416 [Heterodermia aff. obscurata]
MSVWSYQMLRHEASVSIQTMSAVLSEPFESMFISRVDEPLLLFDNVLRLHEPDSFTSSSKETDALDHKSRSCQRLYDALTKGLGDRAGLVYPWFSEPDPWPTDSLPTSDGRRETAYIGIILNADQAYRMVDHGPLGEEKAAAAQYRKFWGEKSELRRFRDGTLSETLIWAQNSNETVIEQIVRYVIQRHCGQDVTRNLHLIGNDFQSLLYDPGPIDPGSPIMSSFERLETEIRRLEGLPLQIRQVTAADSNLRYASLTDATSQLRGKQFVDVCVQFEGSARWPSDIAAVQRTKIAFLFKIGELLEESSTRGLTTRVGIENEGTELVNVAFLDILYPQEAAFRLRIHHEREFSLLGIPRVGKDLGVERQENVAHAAATYKRNFTQSPLHTQAVRTLCTRFPLLSPSMRLMKKWRNSHLLSGHISDELVELLTIRIFVTPYPWQAPASLATAFLRTLTFISRWQWRTKPLIVDFSGSMRREDVERIELRFEAWRKIDPAMNRVVMFAASNLDPEGITWTGTGPVKVVAGRFTALAKAACSRASNQGFDLQAQGMLALSIADYDFVLHLNPRFVTSSRELTRKRPVFKNLQAHAVDGLFDLDSDPVSLYLNELRWLFGNSILFFHDELGGSIIGGIWNPQTGSRRWKINAGYSTIPLVELGQEYIAINKQGTLNDIARLGGDMVCKVEVR